MRLITLPAPLWEVFHPVDGHPIGHAAAWHWETAIDAVALLAGIDPTPLDADLVRLELFSETLSAGTARLIG